MVDEDTKFFNYFRVISLEEFLERSFFSNLEEFIKIKSKHAV